MMNRIKKENISVNYENTNDFFTKRAEKNVKHVYNTTMYQDDEPDLVVYRDQYEKDKMSKILDFSSSDDVLDIGCGVGRWGEEVLKTDANYLGLDFNDKILDIAYNNLISISSCFELKEIQFGDICNFLRKKYPNRKYSKVLIVAVMIYINDIDIKKLFSKLDDFLLDDALIYIKESMAISERLTLKDYYSDELKSKYNAIYRTRDEYLRLIMDGGFRNFKIEEEGLLYPDNLNNRKETSQYYMILKKVKK